MESFIKFWNVILAFILLFIIPISLYQIRNSMISDIQIVSSAEMFLDQMKYSGYIDKRGLSEFMKKVALISSNRNINIIHKRRAIRPIFMNEEIEETKEFYIDIAFDEIKKRIRNGEKYSFFAGDKVIITIVDSSNKFLFYKSPKIELGGMIENEVDES